jgi:hypothetical protein
MKLKSIVSVLACGMNFYSCAMHLKAVHMEREGALERISKIVCFSDADVRKKWQDVAPLANRFVVYSHNVALDALANQIQGKKHTDQLGLNLDQDYPVSDDLVALKYGYIEPLPSRPVYCPEEGQGYLMQRVLKKDMGFHNLCLTDETLKRLDVIMRLATLPELKHIGSAIQSGQARLNDIRDPEKIKALLEESHLSYPYMPNDSSIAPWAKAATCIYASTPTKYGIKATITDTSTIGDAKEAIQDMEGIKPEMQHLYVRWSNPWTLWLTQKEGEKELPDTALVKRVMSRYNTENFGLYLRFITNANSE